METKHWLLEGINEWKQLSGKYNWFTFTPIQIYFKNEKWLHGYELQIIILGLGFRLRHNTDKALEHFDEWEREVDIAVNAKKLQEFVDLWKK